MGNFKKQAGISLLEMMISLSLGLILLAGLISVYLVANRASGQASFLAQMDQSANDIFYRLGEDAKRAGFVDVTDTPRVAFTSPGDETECFTERNPYFKSLNNLTDGSPVEDIYKRRLPENSSSRLLGANAVRLTNRFMTPLGFVSCGNMQPVIGCGDGEQLSGDPSAKIDSALSCETVSAAEDDNVANRQQIQFAYQGADASVSSRVLPDTRVLPDPAVVDCAGNQLSDIDEAGKTQNGFIVNRYYLAEDGNANHASAFTCKGNAGNAAALVDGVQELTFRYALSAVTEASSTENTTSRVVTKYADADELNGEANADNNFGWSQVVGVEVCFVLSAPIPNTAGMRALASVQGNTRPTCARKDDGSFEDNIAKTEAEQNRYFKRYDKVIALPNMLYNQAGE